MISWYTERVRGRMRDRERMSWSESVLLFLKREGREEAIFDPRVKTWSRRLAFEWKLDWEREREWVKWVRFLLTFLVCILFENLTWTFSWILVWVLLHFFLYEYHFFIIHIRSNIQSTLIIYPQCTLTLTRGEKKEKEIKKSLH